MGRQRRIGSLQGVCHSGACRTDMFSARKKIFSLDSNRSKARVVVQNFVALDFETASRHRASACEMSLVAFKDGKPATVFSRLL